jgi:hypothetical protein
VKQAPVWIDPLLMLAGGLLVVAGCAVIYWPAALIVLGVLLIAAGWPKGGA